MKHATQVTKFNGNLEGLAENIGDLRYDALAEFLSHLQKKLEKDSLSDREKGRTFLAEKLRLAGAECFGAKMYIDGAWDISEKYMKDQDKKEVEFVERSIEAWDKRGELARAAFSYLDLQDNWGGHEETIPLAQSIFSFLTFIENLDDKLLTLVDGDSMYPNPHGTISIDFETGDTGVFGFIVDEIIVECGRDKLTACGTVGSKTISKENASPKDAAEFVNGFIEQMKPS